ncbi:glycosyltransferase family 2 protein [Bacteroides sp.]|uniref:glycosyltransferase family 2 protein n=1 Tax=Bacteroides sp. TaxID=29523 RepID=UPI003A910AAC
MSQVAIIIPVHNTAVYLKHCVESVRNQTLKDIEIILVDNLSSDGSAQICDDYALMDSRIKTLHLTVAGLSIARNVGIASSVAPYIGFVDSDDWIEPTMYEDLLDALVSYEADMSYCNYCCEYEDGHKEQLYPNSGRIYSLVPKDVVIDILLDKVSSSSCTKLFRRELFDIFTFPEGVYYEDHLTVYKWAAQCNRISWIDKTYYNYLQREGSICHSPDLKKLYDYFLAEYDRLSFVENAVFFNEKEREILTARIVKHCLWIFNTFIRKPNHTLYKQEIKAMKLRLREFLSLPREVVDPQSYRRLRKISYFWPMYYLTHCSRKNKVEL